MAFHGPSAALPLAIHGLPLAIHGPSADLSSPSIQIFMKPLPNLATAEKPAAWIFGYMHAHTRQDGIIRTYWPEGDSSKLDPVGRC